MCLQCKDQILSIAEHMKAYRDEVQVKQDRPLSNRGEAVPEQTGAEILLILQREGKR